MSVENQRKSVKPRTNTSHLGETMQIERHRQPIAATPTKAFLNVIRSRADLGVHVFIDGPVSIGRDPACSIPLHDFSVSRQHAVITPQPNGEFVLKDLRSTNGTRVDGCPLAEPRVLKDGEKIYLGDTVLRFALADKVDIDFHSEVATLVSTDPLTGLPAKRRFDHSLEYSLDAAKQSGSPLSLMMMDMDGVKQINDTHGHLFGAHVIGQTGRLIADVVGRAGHACRFGGDEFSAFLPGLDLATAKDVGEKIRQSIESAGMQKDGISLRPTISIGIACFPDVNEMLDLVAVADEALYRAKAQGKNCVAY